MPAFSRVEPASTSGPTSSPTTRSAIRESPGGLPQVTRIVRAPRRPGARESAADERCDGTCRNADDQVPRSRLVRPARPVLGPVLGALARPKDRAPAARDHGLHAAWVGPEGRWKLGRLEDGEAPARARAEEIAVSARQVGFAKHFCRTRDRRARLAQRGEHGPIFRLHQTDDARGPESVEIARAGVRPFGRQASPRAGSCSLQPRQFSREANRYFGRSTVAVPRVPVFSSSTVTATFRPFAGHRMGMSAPKAG